MSTLELGIDEAAAGMVLGADLKDDAGAVLLPAGATLAAATLASLRRRGVATLTVQAPDTQHESAEREAACARQLDRLAHLFRRSAQAGGSAHLLERLCAYRRNG